MQWLSTIENFILESYLLKLRQCSLACANTKISDSYYIMDSLLKTETHL